MIKCSKCMSQKVEPLPNGKLWHCHACGEDFQEAAAEIPPEFMPKPPARKKGGRK